MKKTHEEQNLPTFEEVKLEFITAWEEGNSPTLPEFAQRYPHCTEELVEFVLEFLAFNNAAENTPESTAVPETALGILRDMMAAADAKPQNLTEARQSMGWSVGQLARNLNLPLELTLKVVRGYEEWPPRMVKKVSQVFALPLSQAAQLLSNTRPILATQFKATGQPESPNDKGKSFQADLEDFDQRGKLTPEQRQEWLLDED